MEEVTICTDSLEKNDDIIEIIDVSEKKIAHENANQTEFVKQEFIGRLQSVEGARNIAEVNVSKSTGVIFSRLRLY